MSPVLPTFQLYECTNPDCQLRFPSNLSVEKVDFCPFCSSAMRPIGESFSNYQSTTVNQSTNLKFSLILDNLRSSQNVGSIFRSADGAGVEHLYCCGTTPTPEHPKVIKSSLGAEDHTPWSYHPNAVNLIVELKTTGSRIIALESTEHSTSLFDFSFENFLSSSYVIVIGNEIAGVDPGVLELSDEVLHIPMVGIKSSLNAAVSAGIAIYHLRFVQLPLEKR